MKQFVRLVGSRDARHFQPIKESLEGYRTLKILKNAAAVKPAAFGAALAIAVAGIASEAQATQGGAGWHSVARSGGFFPDPTLQDFGINLGVNGPRLVLSTSGGFQSWGFEYNIPGGAPANTQILYDVYCTKKPIH